MPRIQLPHPLAGVFFEHVCETSRIWELPTAEGELPIELLLAQGGTSACQLGLWFPASRASI